MTQIVKFEENSTDWGAKKDLIKRTICKGASDEELEMVLHICRKTGLDPFMKQIYFVKRWSSADKKEVMSIQTSIDGFRLIAERTGRYAPGRETRFEYGKDGNLVSATVYVKKLTLDGTWHEISHTVYYEEYVQRTKEGKPTHFWEKMPHVMLGKCGESGALRKAFPGELSGLYTFDEMAQASKVTQSQEALDLEHAQAIEMSQRSEEDLYDELYDKTRSLKQRERFAEYLESCLSRTKKSKRDFLEASINDLPKLVEAYEKWLQNNPPSKNLEAKNMDMLDVR